MRAFVASIVAMAVSAQQTLDIPVNNSAIQMTIDGTPTTKYIASAGCSSSGSSYTCNMNNRGFIINSPNFDTGNPDFYKPNLVGGHVEYDINLSAHECGCFNTFYTLKVPALNSDGSLWNTDGYFYCDANGPGNAYCPEMDVQEANKWGWATTPHSCNAPNAQGHYDWCDHSGQCALNIVDQLGWDGYGPGNQYKINTLETFHVKVSFDSDGSSMNSITTTFTQGGNTQTMSTNCSYLGTIQCDIADGMAFIVSNWEGDDSWLRKDRCSGGCPGGSVETISNITVQTGTVKPSSCGGGPPGPYDPSKYQFGNGCAHATDGQCGAEGCPSTDHCKWSWPWGESYDGPNADCRCDIATQ